MSALDFYYGLSSDDPALRIQAAVGLISSLEANDSKPDWDYALNRLVRGLGSSRGGSRLGFSMALTELLTSYGRAHDHPITVAEYLNLLSQHTSVTAGITGHESRSLHFGRLFGLQSLANSTLLLRPDIALRDYELVLSELLKLAAKKPWLRESCFFTIAQFVQSHLVTAHVAFDATRAIVLTLERVHSSSFDFTPEGLALYLAIPRQMRQQLAPELPPTWKHGDPMSQGNLANVVKAIRDVIEVEEAEEEYRQSKLQPNNLQQRKTSNTPKARGSNWNSNLHFVWVSLAQEFKLYQDNGKKSKKAKSDKGQTKDHPVDAIGIEEFWKAVVDQTLFANSASVERKYNGFQVFNHFLTTLPSDMLTALFTPNFLRSFINQLASTDRLLNKAAKKVAQGIMDRATQDPAVVAVIIPALVAGKYGTTNFDRLTKTKTVDGLLKLTNGSPETVQSLILTFIDIFKHPAEEDLKKKKNNKRPQESDDENDNAVTANPHKTSESKRTWALDQLLNLVRNNKMDAAAGKKHSWLECIISFLVEYGYFEQTLEVPLAANTQSASRSRVASVLTAIVSLPREDGSTWAYFTLRAITKYQAKHSDAVLLCSLEETERDQEDDDNNDEKFDLIKQRDRALRAVENIRNKRQSSPHVDSVQLKAFELLFSLVLVQVYAGDSEAAGVLEELQHCYMTMLNKREVEEGGDENLESDEASDTSVILIEILLSFTSQQSALLRKLSETVFEIFTSEITQHGLDLLYNVINSKESKLGQESLFDKDEEEDEEEEEEDDDEEDDEEEDDDEEKAESESESESDSDSDAGDMIQEADKKLNVALAQALGMSQDGELVSDSGSESDDDQGNESMDDEQMIALDEQLAAIFKTRQSILDAHHKGGSKKQDAREAREMMVTFKSRVLDLLDIYARKEASPKADAPANTLVLTMIMPLLSLIRLTGEKSLGEKAHAILKNRVCKMRQTPPVVFDNDSDDDHAPINAVSHLMALLGAVHHQAKHSTSHPHFQACSQVSVFIVKTLVDASHYRAMDAAGAHDLRTAVVDQVVDVYAQTMKDWMAKKSSKIQPAMFFDFINWMASVKK